MFGRSLLLMKAGGEGRFQAVDAIQAVMLRMLTAIAPGKVRFMNPVAEQLTGWSNPEVQGLPSEDVFRIVNEQTRDRVESPVSKVLRERKIIGLANHTVLIGRDMSERPIEDSGGHVRHA